MSLRPLLIAGAPSVLLAALAAASLAGCGKLGQLEKPSALNGAGRSTTRQADEAARQAQDPQRPVDTIDPRDRTSDPAPPRALPIQGAGQDPFAPGPPGAFGNPFTNPR
jgi:predicted small lipoprotein YifL